MKNERGAKLEKEVLISELTKVFNILCTIDTNGQNTISMATCLIKLNGLTNQLKTEHITEENPFDEPDGIDNDSK